MAIEVKNLTFVYSPKTPFEKVALDDVTFDISDGDFFGIVGQTGSGKSTLVSHFNALTRVQRGEVFVLGRALSQKKLDLKRLRADVGMVFQYPEYQLFADTVEKDVEFGCRNIGLSDAEIKERVRQAIELVGLDYFDVKDRSPFELSGGQKRRAALAGVLAMRPKILVLDEPTAGLDPRGKREIMELVMRTREHCPTTVMISHNMDEVARYCNKIAVLSAAKLYGVFSPKELFVQKELLVKLGLGMPSVTRIADRLADTGFAVDRGIVKIDELVEAIERELKGGEQNA